jgi:hypothetical protein
MPQVAHVVALDRLIDPDERNAPHPSLITQLRRIIRHALSQHSDGIQPDSRLFHDLHTLLSKRLLSAIPRINHTVAMTVTAPGIAVTRDLIDFTLKAVECGAVSWDKWDKVTVAVAFHRIGDVFPEKHAACIRKGLPILATTTFPAFENIHSTAVELWKVHHAPGCCDLQCLDDTIANLVAHADAYDEEESPATSNRASYREQLFSKFTVLNNLLWATMALPDDAQNHILSMTVEPVSGPVPSSHNENRTETQSVICSTAK